MDEEETIDRFVGKARETGGMRGLQRFKQSPEPECTRRDSRRWVMRRSPRLLLPTLVVAALFCGHAHAQWTTRTFSLNPGWNAVFLNVEPEPNDCATVFSGVPIDSVWYWSSERSTVQFVRDPSKIMPNDPDWRAYFPDTSIARAATTLRVLRGNRPYMIKLGGTAPVNWAVRGKPSMHALTWLPNSYNLVGFQTDPAGAPTFQKLFAGSTAHAGQPVFRLRQNTQSWEQVTAPASEKPDPGEALWVWTSGASTYQGPLRVESASHGDIDFGRAATELRVNAWNDTAAAKTCTLRVLDSESPPSGASPGLAGAVPLSYWKDDYATGDAGWRAYANAQPMTAPVASGKYKSIRLSVRRRDMTPAAAPENTNYQSIVQISDGEGMLVSVPVTALGLQTSTGAKAMTHAAAGLWVGSVTVNKVSQPEMHGKHYVPGEGGDSEHPETVTDIPQPTGSEFNFTLIVHVDAAGTARLLQQVTLMWQDGTYKPDPMFAGGHVVDTPGHYVLITDESLLSKFKGASMRGGVSVGRRYSTPAFTWSSKVNNQLVNNRELDMTGVFPTPEKPVPASPLTCTLALGYDDRLNPYKHIYHPDHNNLDEYQEPLDPAKVATESWDITRVVSLEFIDFTKSGTVDDAAYAGWGDKWIGGTYRETIAGTHRSAVNVQGTFRLNYISDVPELNPGS